MIKRNIIANYVGTAWSALMGFIFVPWYIKYLGAEAYGVVGISVVLQTYLSLLDLGLTPMMGREMARFTAGAHDAGGIRSLLRVIELIMWSTSAIAVLCLWMAADWIAGEWLRSETLPPAEIAHALRILAAVVGMRFIEGMYRGCIVGLQFQVMASVIASASATLRGAGAVAVLAWWSPTLGAFFWWQGTVSLVSMIVLAISAHRLLPKAHPSLRAGIALLNGTRRFAAGMLVSAVLVLLLSQTDKVLLTRLLPLAEYGKYTLSLAVAGCVTMAAAPIGQAVYPKITELYARGGGEPLARAFHRSAQLITVVSGSAASVLLAFADVLLAVWTSDPQLAAETTPVVRILALSTFLHATLQIPYYCQLATGWTSLSNWVNLLSLFVIVPALLWAVPAHGTLAAAAVSLGLILIYFTIGAPISFSRVMTGEMWRWYSRDILFPFAAACLAAGCIRLMMPLLPPSGATGALCAAVGGLFAAAAATLAAPEARRMIRASRHVHHHESR